jgi:hypothetical protein
LALLILTIVLYGMHLLAASWPRRRALIAVATTSLLFLPAYFTFHLSRIVLELDLATLDAMGWVVLAARILLPLGFLVALLQADLLADVARGRLLEELAQGPSPKHWRDAAASALDDPGLRIAYWDPVAARYREPDGAELAPRAPPGRAWHEVDRNGRPVAAMDIDAVLAEGSGAGGGGDVVDHPGGRERRPGGRAA